MGFKYNFSLGLIFTVMVSLLQIILTITIFNPINNQGLDEWNMVTLFVSIPIIIIVITYLLKSPRFTLYSITGIYCGLRETIVKSVLSDITTEFIFIVFISWLIAILIDVIITVLIPSKLILAHSKINIDST